jgi:hypothetical protein
MRFGKKRLLVGASVLAGLGGAAALVAGTTFGLFSTSQTGTTNSFSSGTVTLTNPVSVKCTVGPMEPGDSSTGYGSGSGTDSACTFTVTYTGTLGAFIGVSTTVTGTLYATGNAKSLRFKITDTASTSYTTTGNINTNSSSPLYVNDTLAGTHQHKFTVNYELPATATNLFQGKTTTLTLTVHAVQDSNNGTGCTTAKGAECATVSHWS